jgi:hypothetical protein
MTTQLKHVPNGFLKKRLLLQKTLFKLRKKKRDCCLSIL